MSQESKNDREQDVVVNKDQLILSDTGEPFETEVSARLMASNKGLEAKTFKIVKNGPGYAIEVFKKNEANKEIKKEPCFLVTFAHQSSVNDTIDVMLSVQGEALVIQRNKPVVLPKRFLEAADHALIPHYTQKPGEGRKIIGMVKTYEYSILREATWDEYTSQKAEGTRKSLAFREANLKPTESAIL